MRSNRFVVTLTVPATKAATGAKPPGSVHAQWPQVMRTREDTHLKGRGAASHKCGEVAHNPAEATHKHFARHTESDERHDDLPVEEERDGSARRAHLELGDRALKLDHGRPQADERTGRHCGTAYAGRALMAALRRARVTMTRLVKFGTAHHAVLDCATRAVLLDASDIIVAVWCDTLTMENSDQRPSLPEKRKGGGAPFPPTREHALGVHYRGTRITRRWTAHQSSHRVSMPLAPATRTWIAAGSLPVRRKVRLSPGWLATASCMPSVVMTPTPSEKHSGFDVRWLHTSGM